jgi:hypothetical protein
MSTLKAVGHISCRPVSFSLKPQLFKIVLKFTKHLKNGSSHKNYKTKFALQQGKVTDFIKIYNPSFKEFETIMQSEEVTVCQVVVVGIT